MSKSWCSDIYYSLTVKVLFLWGALSDERTGLFFVYDSGPHQRSLSGVRVPWTRDYILLSQIRDFLFVASYDSQAHGGRIRPQSQSYITTDGQSASLSLCQAPIWGLRPDFYYCQTVAGLLMWGVLSDERTGLPFSIAAGCRQCSHSWVRVHILLSQIRDFPNLQGQVPVFIFPGNRVAQLYPRHWVIFDPRASESESHCV
jgi:hypothetical protein